MLVDNPIISKWLIGENQIANRSDSEVIRRPRSVGHTMNVAASRNSIHGAFGRMNPAAISAGHSGYSGIQVNPAGTNESVDFDPALLRGYRGYPGFKVRVNKRAFDYTSALVYYVLDQQIPSLSIPDINQTVEQASAEVTICNIYVSNYRSPDCVKIYPAAPNLIVFSIENLDFGLTGNLDALAMLLIPIDISGIVHANIYHASATITLSLERTPYGAPYVALCGCDVDIPYADLCIECGGFFGELINIFFRQTISSKVRTLIPTRVCEMLPNIINQRVNPMLARFQSVPFSQILAPLLDGLLGPSLPPQCLTPECQARLKTTTKPPPTNNGLNAMPPRNPPSPTFRHGTNRVRSFKNKVAKAAASVPIRIVAPEVQSKLQMNVEKGRKTTSSKTAAERNIRNKNQKYVKSFFNSGLTAQSFKQPVPKIQSSLASPFARSKREVAGFKSPLSNIPNNITAKSKNAIGQSQQTVKFRLAPKMLEPLRNHQQKPQGNSKFIDKKSFAMPRKSPFHPSTLARHSSKAIAFSGQTSNKFNRSAVHGVQMYGGFPGGHQSGVFPGGHQSGVFPGGHRSGVFPGVHQSGVFPGGHQSGVFPGGYQSGAPQAIGVAASGSFSDPCAGCPPAPSGLIGSLGSLIRQQLDLRKVANLLLTTQIIYSYATSYDYNFDINGEFSPYGYGGTPFGPFPLQWPTPVGAPMIEIMISDFTINSLFYWLHRVQFLSFRLGPETPGIGALLTTTCDVSDDYPEEEFEGDNETLIVRLLHLSQRRHRFRLHHFQQRSKRQVVGNGNGDMGEGLGDLSGLGICLASVQVNLAFFVDIYLDKTNIRAGTITVTIVTNIMIQIMGNRVTGNATLPILMLMDRDKTLGLEQDALDTLASLAKDMFLKAINERLSKGMQLPLPMAAAANLPINITDPQIQLLERAIYIGSDFVVVPSVLQMFSLSPQ
ncbi:unnamed protein product [Onchocerca ochengi]|uniref:BPI2 domain-containing protein n=1 Tax=Onchocerca ochengi TaxID=42157 RepID=A0A182DXL0_ONCOC|nr:unnamed protein product [Onchocerca ochengi]